MKKKISRFVAVGRDVTLTNTTQALSFSGASIFPFQKLVQVRSVRGFYNPNPGVVSGLPFLSMVFYFTDLFGNRIYPVDAVNPAGVLSVNPQPFLLSNQEFQIEITNEYLVGGVEIVAMTVTGQAADSGKVATFGLNIELEFETEILDNL